MKSNNFKIIFLFSIGIITVALFAYLRSFYDIDRWKHLFHLDEDVETLIIGDSHLMTALDPDIIKKSRNICATNENYIFTYLKLKHFLYRNPQINTVVIGFSYHNVSKMYGEMYLYHDATEKEIYRRYFILLDESAKSEIKKFRKNFIIAYLKYNLGFPIQIYSDKFVFKYLLRRNLTLTDFQFVGGYYNSDLYNVNIADVKERIKKYYYDENMMYQGKTILDIEYLHRILNICEKKGIRIFLYNSPVLPVYKNLIPIGNIVDFESVKSEILSKYKHAEYINHSDFEIEERNFGDGDHVNTKGAKIVSNVIGEIINNFKRNERVMPDDLHRSDVSRFPEDSHRLHPAEDLLDPLSNCLVDTVIRVSQ